MNLRRWSGYGQRAGRGTLCNRHWDGDHGRFTVSLIRRLCVCFLNDEEPVDWQSETSPELNKLFSVCFVEFGRFCEFPLGIDEPLAEECILSAQEVEHSIRWRGAWIGRVWLVVLDRAVGHALALTVRFV